MLQANEVLKGVLGYGELLSNDSLLLDMQKHEALTLRRTKRRDCLGCQGILASSDLELTYDEACARWNEFVLVDIREQAAVQLPVNHICRTAMEVIAEPPTGILLLSCVRGIRSQQVAMEMRSRGYTQVFSLKHGASSFGI